MFVRKFVVMAFGLTAFAGGSALGQTESNVPSPNGFDDQLECATNAVGAMLGMPNMQGMSGGMSTPSSLDVLLRGTDGMGTIMQIGDGSSLTEAFPVTPNCGSGTIGSMSASHDLAQGYQDVYNAYQAVATARAALKLAEDRSGVSSATATAARTRLTEAQNALDALAMGPIYQAGIAEWNAVPAVTGAIDAWNTAVGAENGTLADRTGYLGANQTLGEASFENYRPITTGTYTTATGVYEAGAGNFDDDDNFVYNATSTSAVSAGTVSAIRTALEGFETIIGQINVDIDDAPASANQRHQTLNDSLALAVAERNYIQGQLNAAYADGTDLDTDGDGNAVTNPDSIAGRNSAYLRARSAVTAAESALRGAVNSRVAASKAVLKHFTSAESYLAQNVYRHTFLVSEAETARAAEAAREKLTAAQELNAKFDAYFTTPDDVEFDAENPAGDLLNALLKPSESSTTPVVDDNGAAVTNNNVPTSSDGDDDALCRSRRLLLSFPFRRSAEPAGALQQRSQPSRSAEPRRGT